MHIVRREYLASSPDSVIVFRLEANRRGALNLRLTLTAQIPHTVEATRHHGHYPPPRHQSHLVGLFL